MIKCPNCGKEINQNAQYCPYCQKYTSKKEEKEIDLPRLIAIGTFIYSFIFLVGYQFFTKRLEMNNFYSGLLLGLFGSAILAVYPIIKKPRFFRFLSLFCNLFMILRYAIWVNSFEGGGFIP